MAPKLCIVGRSGTGKTTLLERLVPELKRRGYRIAVVKHTDKDVDVDIPGKDSWRIAQAGSDAVLLCTGSRVMTNTFAGRRLSLSEALGYLNGDYDLVLIEGFHENALPKIEVHRKELQQPLRSNGPDLMAVVTDERLVVAAPQFQWDDIGSLADFAIEKLLSPSDIAEKDKSQRFPQSAPRQPVVAHLS